MAVFGLPKLHEDDALRAVRAAYEMQRALEQLNLELDLTYGVELSNRTGVNTGEVVAGDATTGQRLVTGDAVNVAARLEQAAAMNEVLIGELTYRLVRDAVQVEPVEPLELKGKAERVAAYQLMGVTMVSEGYARRQDAPMIGRERELASLTAMYAAAVGEIGCRSSTVRRRCWWPMRALPGDSANQTPQAVLAWSLQPPAGYVTFPRDVRDTGSGSGCLKSLTEPH